MKKLLFLIVAIVVLGLIVSGCLPVVPPAEQGEISSLKKPNNNNNGLQPGIDFNGPHYNLNLIGKKEGWSGGGSYDNPDRHTIFVPENTDGWTTPNGEDGLTIWMTQGDEFKVVDGNAFDEDGVVRFQLGEGEYNVYIVAKGKPGGETNITGWVYCYDTSEYYFSIGSIKVTKSKKWKNATGLFYVDNKNEDEFSGSWPFGDPIYPVWVFTYLQMLKEPLVEGGMGMEEALYFWQYDNKGNKLVKVRFYRIEK